VSEPLHYAATPGCVTIYLGAVPVLIARRDYHIVGLARDALAEPTRLAAGAVALGGDDAAVLAVERLVRVIDGGCR
jgi:hypothetical protein